MNTLAVQRQVYGAYKRRGGKIALRQFTSLPGPTPYSNPPTLDTPLVDGVVPRGSLSLSIRAQSAVGRLIAGDTLSIAGASYTVAQACNARTYPSNSTPGFDSVQLTSGIIADVADGAAISIVWIADLPTYAMVSPFPVSLMMNGDMIQMKDLRVMVPAFRLPPPDLTWRVALNGRDYAIISKQATYIGTDVIEWMLQAR